MVEREHQRMFDAQERELEGFVLEAVFRQQRRRCCLHLLELARARRWSLVHATRPLNGREASATCAVARGRGGVVLWLVGWLGWMMDRWMDRASEGEGERGTDARTEVAAYSEQCRIL